MTEKNTQVVFDFHTHPYLQAASCLSMYDKSVLSPAMQREMLRKAGICGIAGSVIIPMKEGDGFSVIRDCNREALALRDALDGFYIPGVHIQPAFVRESEEELYWAREQGITLVGELVPYFHGWKDYDDEGFLRILETVRKLHMVVSVHCTDDDRLDAALAAFPDIPFVAAHPGDRARALRHIERMKRFPNLSLDLSGTGLFRLGVLKRLVDEVGSERILFGTDYPICNPGMYVAAVEYEDITEEDRENVFHKNAERLLGLNA